MNAGKALFLTIVGFLAGILFIILFTTAVLVGGTALTVKKMLDSDPATGFVVEGNSSLGTMSQELTKAFGTMKIGQGLAIGETELTRIIAAGLQENLTSEVTIHSLELDIENGRMAGRAFLTIRPDQTPRYIGSVKKIPLSLDFALKAAQRDGELYFQLERIRIGQFVPPMALMKFLARRSPVLLSGEESGPMTFYPADLAFALPLSSLDNQMGQVAVIRSLRFGEDQLHLGIQINPRISDTFMAHLDKELEGKEAEVLEVLEKHLDNPPIMDQAEVLLDALSNPGDYRPDSPVALLSYCENEVSIIQDGQKYTGEIGTDLSPGTSIETGLDSLAELILLNGSILHIGENSQFSLDQLPGPEGQTQDTRLSFASGKIRAVVADLSSSGGGFEIVAPTAVLGVRGTDFIFTLEEGGGLEVLVFQGRVSLDTAAAPAVLIDKEEKVEATREQLSSPVLEKEAFGPDEIHTALADMQIISQPEDAEIIRRTRAFWRILEQLMRMISRLSPEEQEKLEDIADELEPLLDMANLVRELENLGLDTGVLK
jgi:hypothetical protein